MKFKLLITGANSPLGQAVARRAKLLDCSVTGTLRKLMNLDMLPMFDCLLPLNLEDPDSIRALSGEFDAVIHVAGLSSGSTEKLFNVNAMGSERLIKRVVSLKAKRFIYVSGISIYGEPKNGRVDSDTPIRHSSPYGASKWMAECLLSHLQDKIAVTCVRSPAIVGHRDPSHRNFISSLYSAMQSGVSVIEVSNPDFLFNNVIHDETLADFLVDLSFRHSTTPFAFPVGSSPNLRLEDVVRFLVAKTQFEGRIRWKSSPNSPFQIVLDDAVKNGFQPITTSATLEKWLDD